MKPVDGGHDNGHQLHFNAFLWLLYISSDIWRTITCYFTVFISVHSNLQETTSFVWLNPINS